MKKTVFVLAFACLCGPAFAGTVENAIGNTIMVKTADGSTIKTMLKADGTVSRILPDGTAEKGTWTNANGTYCQTFGGKQECPHVFPDKKVGDTWEDKDSAGEPISVSLVPGQ